MATAQIALSRHRTPVSVQRTQRQVVPAFLQKLHEMVNDPNNVDLIRWSDAGDSFYVLDHERFAREVLGRWFKHQNFASFVRQLNMYGFHKIPHLQQGVLRSDTDTEFWNFAHANFLRGQPDLLCLIQRKKQAPQPGDEALIDIREATNTAPTPPNTASGQIVDIHSIVNGIAAIKRHQSTISAELNELKRSNQLLWQDAMDARAKHQKQQDTINRIVKFLAGVFGNHASPHKEDVVESIPSRAVVPRRRSRFMIEDGRAVKVTIEDVQDISESATGEQPIHDIYPTVETPLSVSSPTPSDNVNPSSTYLDAHHTPREAPSPQPPPLSTDTGCSTSQQTPAAGIASPTFQSSDITERAVTPNRHSPPNMEFDPRIQVVLNQLTPTQIQQLLSSLAHTIDPVSATDHPQSSQLTQYTPQMDLFTQFMNSSSPPPAHTAPVESLLSFDDHPDILPSTDDTARIAKSWKDTDEIDRDVNAMSTDIDTFIRGLGLDPDNLATDSTSPAFHTELDDAHADMSTLEGGSEASDTHSPPDSLFDIDSFLNHFTNSTGDPGLGYSNNGETLVGQINPESQPQPHTPQSSQPNSPKTVARSLSKRKPDAASDLPAIPMDTDSSIPIPGPLKTSKRRRNK